jgi:hypothetical protein
VDVLRVAYITDIKNPDSPQTVFAHNGINPFGSAIEAAFKALTGNKKQVPVNGNITLGSRAEKINHNFRAGRVGNIPNHKPVVTSLKCVVVLECKVGIP